MSSKTRTPKAHTDQRDTTRALQAVPESTDTTAATKARTDTEDRLWKALRANPNNTAADLATDAGIGRSTAAKVLARWANDCSVTRTPHRPRRREVHRLGELIQEPRGDHRDHPLCDAPRA